VDLVRSSRPQARRPGALDEQIGLVERDAVAQVLDPVETSPRRTARHPGDVMSLLEQKLSQGRAIPAR